MNAVQKIPFTAEKYNQMQQEFDRLTLLRKEVMVRLQTAREMGDLSENGAYKYAKFELGDIGRRLRELRKLLDAGEIVRVVAAKNGVIVFGSTVTLKGEAGEITYQFVSEFESDPSQNKLSFASPLGRALRDKKVGDTITVHAPVGAINYKIIEVA